MSEPESPDQHSPDAQDTTSRRRPVTRRQFLDGVAISSTGLAIAAASPTLTGAQAASLARGGHRPPPQPIAYPPTSTGITGQPDDVIDGIVRIDGRPEPPRRAQLQGWAGHRPAHPRPARDL